MNTTLLALLLLVLLCFLIMWSQTPSNAESMAGNVASNSNPLSNEAIQNIGSVYNKDNLTVTNLNVTNQLNSKTLAVTDDVNNTDNPTKLNFTTNWKASPDNYSGVSEISNDIDTFKALVIGGNKALSGKQGPRNILMYDNVSIPAGNLFARKLGVYQEIDRNTPNANLANLNFQIEDGVTSIRASNSDLKIYGNRILLNGMNPVAEISALQTQVKDLMANAVRKDKDILIRRSDNGNAALFVGNNNGDTVIISGNQNFNPNTSFRLVQQ